MGKVFKVVELTNYVSRLLSEDIFLSRLQVVGEISNFNHHSSGHMYFNLKDEDSNSNVLCLKATMKIWI